jgi:photosystem II stability/assembly factor-like uncharacterized protein
MFKHRSKIAIALIFVLGLAAAARSQEDQDESPRPTLPESALETLNWRSIGPANMSGRITSITVYEKDPSMWWVSTASGGLLKTTNNGMTFEHQFDKEVTVSIGDVEVSQSDPNIVWVGTGEENPRNSVSWGDGVYKSNDGGKTWKNMGLKGIFQTGRVVIHPTDPNIVYVAALGRLWGPNEERGLFKTTDGGETWKKVLYIDADTGAIDAVMHPSNSDTLLVATYQRRRDGFDGNDPSVKWGPGAGIYRTTDGGATFTKMTGGLPTVQIGRIGLNYYRKDPNIVYAVIETEKIGQRPENSAYAGISGENADVGARVTAIAENSPAAAAGLQVGDIIISVDGQTVHSNDELNEQVWKHKAGDKVQLEVSRDRESVKLELTFASYPDEPAEGRGGRGRGGERGGGERGGGRGGRGGGNPFAQNLGGQNPNLQDRQGPDGHQYGGVYRSEDGGQSWKRVNSLNPRPMYFSKVRVDPSDDKYVYVLGVQLYRSEDGGKTFTSEGIGRAHADSHVLWIDPKDGRHMILGGDGGVYVTWDRMRNWDHHNHVAIGQFYFVSVGPERNYRVYGGLQDNSSWGGPSRVRNAGGPGNTDWFQLGGGDGFLVIADPNDKDQIYYESQNGAMGRLNLRTGEGGSIRPQPQEGQRFRFNWKTPFMLSPHNSTVFYSAGNYVFRSIFKGSNMRPISPEISTTEQGTGSAITESPVEEGVLYVGTTDGNVWVTRNGGGEWVNVFDNPDQMAQPERRGRRGRGRGRRGGRGEAAQRGEAGGRGEDVGQAAETPAAQQEGAQPAAEAQRDRTSEQRQPAQRPAEDVQVGRGRGGEGAVPGGATPPTEPAGGQQEVRQEQQEQARERTGQQPQEPITPRQVADIATAAQGEQPGAKFLRELVPGKRWVSSIHASKFAPGRCYLTLDAHRSNDDEPYLFMTEDYGRTWRSIRANLPTSAGTTHVLREDISNQDVLYLGCEFSAWVSIDRGKSWTKFNNNLPTVAVHEFALHPTAGEIVAATHGRSLWIADVTHLRQMSAETLAADAHLYRPNNIVRWRREPSRGSAGTRQFTGETPPNVAQIYYSLGKQAESVELTVSTLLGETLYRTDGETEPGLHRIAWNMARQAGGRGGAGARGQRGAAARGRGQRGGGEGQQEEGEQEGGQRGARGQRGGERGAAVARRGGGGGGGRRGRGGAALPAGSYLVTLTVDGQTYKQPLAVEVDPDMGEAILTEEGVEFIEIMNRGEEEVDGDVID